MDTRVDPHQNRFCSRPWKQATFLSDGTAVCACIDAGRSNPLGNLRDLSFDQLWNGRGYTHLRKQIVEDINQVPICRACPNRIAIPPSDLTNLDRIAKPKILYLQSVAACNLVCPGCDRLSIEGGRDGKLVMDWDVYQRIIDGLAPDLEYMEFHLGGENFMHKQWPRMLRYAKEKNPRVFILTSTNGHYFRTEKERQDLVDSGIDLVIMSIDGATAESYVKYRVRGKFDLVMDNMRGVIETRNRAGKSRPIMVWRYILFHWNDTEAEMNLARKLSSEMGVDQLAWHLNVATDEMSSKRYYIGSPHLGEIEHEIWDTIQTRLPVEVNLDFNRY